MLFKNLIVNSGDGLFCVEDGGDIKRNLDVDVGRGGGVFSDIFKEQFWFSEVKILGIDEFRVRNGGARAHFEEAIEDDEE